MSDDNVKAFPGGNGELPDNPMQFAKRPSHFCTHTAVILDEHNRSIYCADPKCGAALDPFDFLRKETATIARAWESHAYVKRELADLTERVANLKKEEQRLRAMVKRLQDKTGAVLDLRNRKL